MQSKFNRCMVSGPSEMAPEVPCASPHLLVLVSVAGSTREFLLLELIVASLALGETSYNGHWHVGTCSGNMFHHLSVTEHVLGTCSITSL